MAFTIAMRATPTSAKTASQSVAIPPAPRMRTSTVAVLLAEAGEERRGFAGCVEVREVGEAGHAEDSHAFLAF